MSHYELWPLILTGIYDALTLLLLIAVTYETFIRPRADAPNIAAVAAPGTCARRD